MSARAGFVEARDRLADKQAGELKAKDKAKNKSTMLKVLDVKASKSSSHRSVPATEAGMTSQTEEQDRLAAPTRDAGTTVGTLVRPELD